MNNYKESSNLKITIGSRKSLLGQGIMNTFFDRFSQVLNNRKIKECGLCSPFNLSVDW